MNFNLDGRDWTREYRETGDLEQIYEQLRELGGENLEYIGRTDRNAMKMLGYDPVANSAYVTPFGSGDNWANFTPISVDMDAYDYGKVLSRAELSQYARDVMNGTREDDLHLKSTKNYGSYEEALEDAIRANYLKKVDVGSWTTMAKKADAAQEAEAPVVNDGAVYTGQGTFQQIPNTLLPTGPTSDQKQQWGRGYEELKKATPTNRF